jgi:hypothetical protein
VEFAGTLAAASSDSNIAATRLGDSDYDVTARVIVAEPDVWVIDAGILLFNQSPAPPGITVGGLVQGRIHVGVDPFFYFERLAKRASLPELIYTWTVRKILRQTAPFIETQSMAQRILVRDPSKLAWEPIAATNAWNDDGGHAEYLLECVRLEEAPRRTSATACMI